MGGDHMYHFRNYVSEGRAVAIKEDGAAGMSAGAISVKHKVKVEAVKEVLAGTYVRPKWNAKQKQKEESALPSLQSIMEAIFEKKRGRIVELEERIKELQDELKVLNSDQDYQAAKAYLAQIVKKVAIQ